MTLSAYAYIEKNKIASSEAWLILLKVTMPDSTEFFIVANNENVTWPVTAGDLYTAITFFLDEIGESDKGEVPSLGIRISNKNKTLEYYLEDQDGLVGSEVDIYIVSSYHVTTPSKGAGVNNNNPEQSYLYEIIDCNSDEDWVYFSLGAWNPYSKRFPRNKVWKNTCPYRIFKGDRCQYVGAETECDRTLATCRSYGNSINFGGKPGVGTKGDFI